MRAQMEDLARLRSVGVEIAERVGRKASGLLMESERDAFRNCDVVLSYTRLTRTIQQIIMQEQEILGLREKRVRQVREMRADAEPRVYVARPVDERKLVRGVVREMVVAQCPELERDDLKIMLDDLFEDYDDFDRGTPAEIVARICTELGVAFDAGIWGTVEPPSEDDGDIGAGGETPSPDGVAATLSPAAEGGSLRDVESDLRSPGRGDFANGHDPP
jgi:hypothetical protein